MLVLQVLIAVPSTVGVYCVLFLLPVVIVRCALVETMMYFVGYTLFIKHCVIVCVCVVHCACLFVVCSSWRNRRAHLGNRPWKQLLSYFGSTWRHCPYSTLLQEERQREVGTQ